MHEVPAFSVAFHVILNRSLFFSAMPFALIYKKIIWSLSPHKTLIFNGFMMNYIILVIYPHLSLPMVQSMVPQSVSTMETGILCQTSLFPMSSTV